MSPPLPPSPSARRLAPLLPALALYPLLQLGPHLWMLRALRADGGDPAAIAFVAAALGADLLFGGLMLGFAVAKARALLHPPVLPARRTRVLATTVLIPVCDEPLDVLRPTLQAAARLGQPVLVVENCRRPGHGAAVAALAAGFGLGVRAVPNRGTKAAALNAVLPTLTTPLVALFDADVVTDPDAVQWLAGVLADDPALAFVQSPQAERNRDRTPVAAAASCQQLYFYAFMAPGWGSLGRALCVGTQCAFRVDALRAVGGFPEDTVTEDVAVSYALHRAGYRSAWLPRVVGRGLAPTRLVDFWRQRSRHAEGAMTLLRRVLSDHDAPLPLRLSYVALATFPMVALGYLCFAGTVLLAARVDLAGWSHPAVYAGAAGAFVLTQVLLLSGMGRQGHGPAELLAGQGGTMMVLPAYLHGMVRGLFGRRAWFAVTPKDLAPGAHPGPARRVLSLLLAAVLAALTVRQAAQAWTTSLGVAVFGGWVLFHVVVLLAPLWVAGPRRAPRWRDYFVSSRQSASE
ncbi:MAG: glycosyltransferase [Alphaproteobacteria bacterium]|nr:glycosyltransferase [Alphaproteobacteria bacterium]